MHIKLSSFKVFMIMLPLLVSCNSKIPQLTEQGVEQVGPSNNGFQNPIWSPDGKKLVVTTQIVVNSWTSEIYLLNVLTGETNIIMHTDLGNVKAVDWSPDGRQILIASQKGGDWPEGIWVIAAEGKSQPEFVADGFDAAWSPDGKSIAIFSRSQKSDFWFTELSILDTISKTREVIFNDKAVAANGGGLDWSPDGKSILFSYGEKDYIDPPRFEHIDLFLLELSTKAVRNITVEGVNTKPSWGPDSNLIVYMNDPGKGHGSTIFMVDKNKGCKQELFTSDDLLNPSWSPDGNHIAFITHGEVNILPLQKFPSYDSVCP
jgi:Tol biopolymer transport system component